MVASVLTPDNIILGFIRFTHKVGGVYIRNLLGDGFTTFTARGKDAQLYDRCVEEGRAPFLVVGASFQFQWRQRFDQVRMK